MHHAVLDVSYWSYCSSATSEVVLISGISLPSMGTYRERDGTMVTKEI